MAIAVAGLTLFAAPWAYRQIGEYHQRFEQRSDLSKVTAGQFAESAGGDRVFFAEDPAQPTDELGNVFARETGPEWLSVLSASSAHSETLPNGDRFLVLGAGHRYDLKPGTPEIRLVNFESTGCVWKARPAAIRWPGARGGRALRQRRAPRAAHGRQYRQQRSQVMWRVSLPLAALNLALLAIPLGAVNPRLGRSGDILIAGLRWACST